MLLVRFNFAIFIALLGQKERLKFRVLLWNGNMLHDIEFHVR